MVADNDGRLREVFARGVVETRFYAWQKVQQCAGDALYKGMKTQAFGFAYAVR